MIHFLVRREDKNTRVNQVLKDMEKDLKNTYMQDIMAQSNLMEIIDRLTNREADLNIHNKKP